MHFRETDRGGAGGPGPEDPLEIAERWLKEGREVALATVVETWGSAPRPTGSHLVIDGKGQFFGSVSGGCVEGAVITEAIDILATGKPRMLEFGVADETAWQVGLSCGGRIKVYVERLGQDSAMDPLILHQLNEERRARRAVIDVKDLASGSDSLIRESERIPAGVAAHLEKAFRSGRSGLVEVEGRPLFLRVYTPPPRIVAIGAVHISQALAPMARLAGYDIEIIDPRTAFATPERFPEVTLITEWPEEVLDQRPLDSYTALAALTHDPKIDDFPLKAALEAGCFYVGALGSRKTHARRVERLLASGLSHEMVARIHAPIGLGIGAANPGEIAVAVLGEIIAALRQREIGSHMQEDAA
jgi:xanthine dehydrogenase accessory factor